MEGHQSSAVLERFVDVPSVPAAEPAWGDLASPMPEPSDSADAAPETLIRVERVEAPFLVLYHAAWSDLFARAIEPNVFLDPAFALPLLQHGAVSARPSFLLVWEESGPASFGRLLGLFPFHLGKARSRFGAVARGFAHKLTSCGMPLVDRDRAEATLAALMTALGETADGTLAALTFDAIAADGPFDAALTAACDRLALSRHVLARHSRAVLERAGEDLHDVIPLASAKRRKERARQRRRLSETGSRTYTSARTPKEIAVAAEHFLALEHGGWKGKKGTSLLAGPKLATFARTMTRMMADEGRCRIDAIEIDGRPIAMGIILKAADRAYFWKTSFDESFAPLSPGVQFALELTQAQLADPSVALTDSCAVADHPMIDKLWPHRATMLDVMVALEPGVSPRFQRCLRLERLRRGLRRQAKAVLTRALRLGRRD